MVQDPSAVLPPEHAPHWPCPRPLRCAGVKEVSLGAAAAAPVSEEAWIPVCRPEDLPKGACAARCAAPSATHPMHMECLQLPGITCPPLLLRLAFAWHSAPPVTSGKRSQRLGALRRSPPYLVATVLRATPRAPPRSQCHTRLPPHWHSMHAPAQPSRPITLAPTAAPPHGHQACARSLT